jgi:methylphosphotriester-DNA--protein-cysteine methyltransferase
MRPFLIVALTLSTFGLSAQTPNPAAQGSVPATTGFVGNKEARIYHTPACKLVLKIKPENNVTFATKDEAVKAGYAPCKICIK